LTILTSSDVAYRLIAYHSGLSLCYFAEVFVFANGRHWSRLLKVCVRATTGCTTDFIVNTRRERLDVGLRELNAFNSYSRGLTTGCTVYTNIFPLDQPVVRRVGSCRRGVMVDGMFHATWSPSPSSRRCSRCRATSSTTSSGPRRRRHRPTRSTTIPRRRPTRPPRPRDADKLARTVS